MGAATVLRSFGCASTTGEQPRTVTHTARWHDILRISAHLCVCVVLCVSNAWQRRSEHKPRAAIAMTQVGAVIVVHERQVLLCPPTASAGASPAVQTLVLVTGLVDLSARLISVGARALCCTAEFLQTLRERAVVDYVDAGFAGFGLPTQVWPLMLLPPSLPRPSASRLRLHRAVALMPPSAPRPPPSHTRTTCAPLMRVCLSVQQQRLHHPSRTSVDKESAGRISLNRFSVCALHADRLDRTLSVRLLVLHILRFVASARPPSASVPVSLKSSLQVGGRRCHCVAGRCVAIGSPVVLVALSSSFSRAAWRR